jgi:hypothetical protein
MGNEAEDIPHDALAIERKRNLRVGVRAEIVTEPLPGGRKDQAVANELGEEISW